LVLAAGATQAAWHGHTAWLRDRLLAADADRRAVATRRFASRCKLRVQGRASVTRLHQRLALAHLGVRRLVQNVGHFVSSVLLYQSIQPAVLFWQSRYSRAVSMWLLTAFSPGFAFGSGGHFTIRFACGAAV
jgi:hypothetical protein